MTSQFLISGVLLALLAGFSNGAFVLPMRYARHWRWENTWLVFSLLSQVVLPWIVALLAIAHLISIFQESPFRYFLPGLIAGSIWGVAQVMYGLGLSMVGIAIGNAVVAGMSTTAGTLGPMIAYAPEKLLTSSGLVFLIAVLLIITGIYLYGKAGLRKERETAGLEAASRVVGGSFKTGLIICLTTGALGTAFIYGLGSSTELLRAVQASGAKPASAAYAAWVVTFNAGFLPNLLYCLYLLRKNRSGGAYLEGTTLVRNSLLATSMAILWFGAILMYGMAAGNMGRLGPSIGFGLFVSGTVLFSNLLGWLAGEWKGASPSTVRSFLRGMALIVIAIFLMALGV